MLGSCWIIVCLHTFWSVNHWAETHFWFGSCMIFSIDHPDWEWYPGMIYRPQWHGFAWKSRVKHQNPLVKCEFHYECAHELGLEPIFRPTCCFLLFCLDSKSFFFQTHHFHGVLNGLQPHRSRFCFLGDRMGMHRVCPTICQTTVIWQGSN